jgi:hypothetical protein
MPPGTSKTPRWAPMPDAVTRVPTGQNQPVSDGGFAPGGDSIVDPRLIPPNPITGRARRRLSGRVPAFNIRAPLTTPPDSGNLYGVEEEDQHPVGRVHILGSDIRLRDLPRLLLSLISRGVPAEIRSWQRERRGSGDGRR